MQYLEDLDGRVNGKAISTMRIIVLIFNELGGMND